MLDLDTCYGYYILNNIVRYCTYVEVVFLNKNMKEEKILLGKFEDILEIIELDKKNLFKTLEAANKKIEKNKLQIELFS